MSGCIYDEALLAKLKSWAEKAQIQVLEIDETSRLVQVIADTTNDTPIKLPLIALSRQSGYEILNVNKKPLTYDGADLSTTYDKSLQLNAIPILINYQLDVYTRYLKEADSYMRELIFNIINHPTLKVTIPYNSADLVHNATIRLASTVEDNSNIPERLISGQFYRLSLKLNIDDAYLWDARVRTNVHITGIYVDPVKSEDEPNDYVREIIMS